MSQVRQVEPLEDRCLLTSLGFQDKIYAIDPGVSDDFGESVAVDGNYAVIGDTVRQEAHIYERFDPGTPSDETDDLWLLRKTLSGFSRVESVDVSGTRVIVGDSASSAVVSSAGAVHVYDRDEGGTDNWGEVTVLTASDPNSGDSFGYSVSIDATTVVVGARSNATGGGSGAGSVYVFNKDQGGVDAWGELKKLEAADTAANDFFGESVDISGSTIVVGAVFDDDNGSASGSAYVFEQDEGGSDNWGQIRKLLASDGSGSDQFGFSVAIDADTIVVGANRHDVAAVFDAGASYVFDRNSGGAENWGQTNKLTVATPSSSDDFGASVSIDGDLIAVGSPRRNAGTSDNGVTFVFERNEGGAGNWGQLAELVDPVVQQNMKHGTSVGVSGSTIFVGGPNDNFFGSRAGSAPVFHRDAGGADNFGVSRFVERRRGVLGDSFGTAVAVDGDRLVVGIPLNGGRGEVWTYQRDDLGTPGDVTDDRWKFFDDLTPSLTSDAMFGAAVAIDGEYLVVGAPVDNASGASDAGTAFVFREIGSGWSQVRELQASDAAVGDEFGASVDISGETVVVGARVGNSGVADSGSAYVFNRNEGGGDNWGEVAELNASNAAAGDEFGISVSIDGDTIAVGAPLGDNGAADVGAAYIYERDNGGPEAWGETVTINASDAAAGDRFGHALSLAGDVLVIGAPENDDGGAESGSAYIHERDQGGADVWGESSKLTASDAAAGDQFGFSVAISLDTVVVGANLDDSSTDTGSIYVFDRDFGGADNWGEFDKGVAADAADNDQFGQSVAIDGNLVGVGIPFDDDGQDDAGSAYTFEINRDVSVTLAPTSLAEDAAGTLDYTLTRSGPDTRPLLVSFDVAGTATFLEDYISDMAASFDATSGTFLIPAGSSSAVLSIAPVADPGVEPDETVDITLSNNGNFDIGTPSSQSGTITNDDDVDVTVAPAASLEDGGPNLVYTFTRASTAGALTVDFNVGGTAAFSTDYSESGADSFGASSGSITFPDTVGMVTLEVDPTTDSVVELDETVSLTLVNGTGYTISFPSDVTGVIINDDSATVSIANVAQSQPETDGVTTLTINLELDAEVDTDVTVIGQTDDGIATAGEDYTAIVGDTFTFAANTPPTQTVPVDVSILGDTTVELDESFLLNVLGLNADGRDVSFDPGQELVLNPRLNAPLGELESIGGLVRITNDMVVYTLAETESGCEFECSTTQVALLAVPVFGGTPVQLTPTLVANGTISSFQISPDGNTVVYVADQDTDNVFELYSVPITGGTATKLNATIGHIFNSINFVISPDSSTVIFRADQDVQSEFELFSVPIGGGVAPVQLNDPLDPGVDVNQTVLVSPDSSRVLFHLVPPDESDAPLFSVPIGGGVSPTQLNPAGTSSTTFVSQISSDSTTVVFFDHNTNGLLHVPIAGGPATPLVPSASNFDLSSDGSRVVFTDNPSGHTELFSVTVPGGVVTKLNDDLAEGGSVTSFEISPDASRVVYLAVQNNLREIFSVPIGGGTVTKLNTPPPVDATSFNPTFEITSDSMHVVYRVDQNTRFVSELFSVPIVGGTPTQLNGPLDSDRNVSSFRVSGDGSTVIYTADQETNNVEELFLVPVTGGTPTKLNGTLAPGGDVNTFNLFITDSGNTAVYSADQFALNVNELFSASIAIQATGTLTNDDSATVTVSANAVSEALGSIPLTATLSGTVDVPFTVDFQTVDGTATGGSDYTAVSGGSLSFDGTNNDTDVATITIATDNTVELDETFTLDLFNVNAGGRTGISLVDNDGTILNDDTATLSITGRSVMEGVSGPTMLDFEVKLLGFIQGGLSVPWTTVDGTATTADSDYTGDSDTLNFAGTSFVDIQTVSIDVNGDNKVELHESFTLDLGTLTAAEADTNAIIINGDPATGIITNDDNATISIADLSQAEGHSGGTAFDFAVTLSNPVDTDVQLTFESTDGSATLVDGDYHTLGGTVGFASGSQSASASVLVHGDTKLEPDENFTVDLQTINAGGRDVAFLDATATGTIENDEVDYGDAPDSTAGNAAGDYDTLSANTGPSHTIVAGLRMGGTIIGDPDGQPNAAATGDDSDGDGDDEDGLIDPLGDLSIVVGEVPTVDVLVTNTTGAAATLFGWIDYNADGVFDNGSERASVAVPDGSTDVVVTLAFPIVPAGAAVGNTFARFRLSTDAAASNPTGAATDGEVEDYVASISRRLAHVVGFDATTGEWLQARSDGSAFSNVTWGLWPSSIIWADVLTLDLNGDGADDLVGRDSVGGKWYGSVANGSGSTTEIVGFWSPVGWDDVMAADVNGDGLDDIVGRQAGDGRWWVALSNGTAFANQLWGFWAPIGWVDVNTADVNGDGNDDIVGRDPGSGNWWVALSDGAGRFTNQQWGTWATGVAWQDVRIADVDGDGNDDIAGRDPGSGNWWVARSDGVGSFTNENWGMWSVSVSWQNVLTADVDGDGDDDIVGRDPISGGWWVARSDGSSFTNENWGTWSAGSMWVDVRIADVDGDGDDDIVGRENATGDWWVARSDGTSGFNNELWGNWNPAVAWTEVGILEELLTI